MAQTVHVAVGIIRNPAQQILIAFRNKQKHQGGLWEFPGGKVEAGESVQHALGRELLEELALEVDIGSLLPILQVEHDYGDKQVLLDIWEVRQYSGEAQGKEGQEIRWVDVLALRQYEFPAANLPIVNFLQNL
jgi:8-oxo-dGTP diphosphatase